jgi:hypothetical protein
MTDSSDTGLPNRLLDRVNLLRQICINTEAQLRFIRQRKMKGLLRLLDERAQTIEALLALGKLDTAGQSGISGGEQEAVRKLLFEIGGLQREMMRINEAAARAAAQEREHIMNDLRRFRSQKQIRKSYDIADHRQGASLNDKKI